MDISESIGLIIFLIATLLALLAIGIVTYCGLRGASNITEGDVDITVTGRNFQQDIQYTNNNSTYYTIFF